MRRTADQFTPLGPVGRVSDFEPWHDFGGGQYGQLWIPSGVQAGLWDVVLLSTTRAVIVIAERGSTFVTSGPLHLVVVDPSTALVITTLNVTLPIEPSLDTGKFFRYSDHEVGFVAPGDDTYQFGTIGLDGTVRVGSHSRQHIPDNPDDGHSKSTAQSLYFDLDNSMVTAWYWSTYSKPTGTYPNVRYDYVCWAVNFNLQTLTSSEFQVTANMGLISGLNNWPQYYGTIPLSGGRAVGVQTIEEDGDWNGYRLMDNGGVVLDELRVPVVNGYDGQFLYQAGTSQVLCVEYLQQAPDFVNQYSMLQRYQVTPTAITRLGSPVNMGRVYPRGDLSVPESIAEEWFDDVNRHTENYRIAPVNYSSNRSMNAWNGVSSGVVEPTVPYVPPAPGTVPGTDAPLMGASTSSNATFNTLNSAAGPFGCRRTFSTGLSANFLASPAGPDYAAGRASYWSFKPNPHTFATDSAAQAAFTAYLATVPAGHRLTIITWHEPEDNISKGEFTLAEWKATVNKVAQLVQATGRPELRAAVCFMSFWTFDTSGYGGTDFLTGINWANIDSIGLDPYRYNPGDKSMEQMLTVGNSGRTASVQSCMAKLTAFGKPFFIAEWGCTQTNVTIAEKARWISEAYAWFKSWNSTHSATRIEAAMYFNNNLDLGRNPKSSWELSGAALTAFAAAVADAPAAPPDTSPPVDDTPGDETPGDGTSRDASGLPVLAINPRTGSFSDLAVIQDDDMDLAGQPQMYTNSLPTGASEFVICAFTDRFTCWYQLFRVDPGELSIVGADRTSIIFW